MDSVIALGSLED